MTSMPSSAVYRLQKDFKQLMDDPIPGLAAQPNPENILEWFFVVSGPADTPFEGGFYLGSLKFPPEYPFKAPALMFHTPNGRFATQTRICLSITDYHQEQWNPTWNVGAILNATISFMTGNEPTFGAIRGTIEEKKAFATQSLAWCLNSDNFKQHFPSLAESIEKELREESKFDTAMQEYEKLKEERAKNPRQSMMTHGIEDFDMQFVRDMVVMGDGPPAMGPHMGMRFGPGAGPRPQYPIGPGIMGLQRGHPGNPEDLQAIDVDQVIHGRNRDPGNAVDAMQRLLYARRAQPSFHGGSLEIYRAVNLQKAPV